MISTRHILLGDGIAFLNEQKADPHTSIITSLPDVSELPELGFAGWRTWFIAAARAVLRFIPEQGCAIFYQSDIRHEGVWIDKAQLVLEAASTEQVALAWHKIVCRRTPGTPTWGRASYSHMLCLCRGAVPTLLRPSPDVLPDAGPSSWTRGMGSAACQLACEYLRVHTSTRLIVDPFCGRGSVLAVASSLGFDVLGVELSAKRCRAARTAIEKALPHNRQA